MLEKVDDMYNRFDTIPDNTGQYWQKCLNNIATTGKKLPL